jgi:hypothetical protein
MQIPVPGDANDERRDPVIDVVGVIGQNCFELPRVERAGGPL